MFTVGWLVVLFGVLAMRWVLRTSPFSGRFRLAFAIVGLAQVSRDPDRHSKFC